MDALRIDIGFIYSGENCFMLWGTAQRMRDDDTSELAVLISSVAHLALFLLLVLVVDDLYHFFDQ